MESWNITVHEPVFSSHFMGIKENNSYVYPRGRVTPATSSSAYSSGVFSGSDRIISDESSTSNRALASDDVFETQRSFDERMMNSGPCQQKPNVADEYSRHYFRKPNTVDTKTFHNKLSMYENLSKQTGDLENRRESRPESLDIHPSHADHESLTGDGASSECFSQVFDKEEQVRRKEYRQRVEDHYHRLVEQEKLSPDTASILSDAFAKAEDRAKYTKSAGAAKSSSVLPRYEMGVGRSVWKAIDHTRSLSMERQKSHEAEAFQERRNTTETTGNEIKNEEMEETIAPYIELTEAVKQSSSKPSGKLIVEPNKTSKPGKKMEPIILPEKGFYWVKKKSGTTSEHGGRTHSLHGSVNSDRSSRLDAHTYQSYAAGILYSSRRSEKFLNLQKHFAVLERISEIGEKVNSRKEIIVSTRPLSLDTSDYSKIISGCNFDTADELNELYSELEDAKKKKEFFYSTSSLSEIQWSPDKDKGLRQKQKSLNDIKASYIEAVQESDSGSLSRNEEITRAVPFSKVTEKYKILEEKQQLKEMRTKLLNLECKETKGDDQKAVPLGYSVTAAAASHHDAKRKYERPIYGTNIEQIPLNKYEIHVQTIKKLSKSEPNVSTLHVRSISAPHQDQDDQNNGRLQRSDSAKDSYFGLDEPVSTCHSNTVVVKDSSRTKTKEKFNSSQESGSVFANIKSKFDGKDSYFSNSEVKSKTNFSPSIHSKEGKLNKRIGLDIKNIPHNLGETSPRSSTVTIHNPDMPIFSDDRSRNGKDQHLSFRTTFNTSNHTVTNSSDDQKLKEMSIGEFNSSVTVPKDISVNPLARIESRTYKPEQKPVPPNRSNITVTKFSVKDYRKLAENNEFAHSRFTMSKKPLDASLKFSPNEVSPPPRGDSLHAVHGLDTGEPGGYGQLRKWRGISENIDQEPGQEQHVKNDSELTTSSTDTFIVKNSEDEDDMTEVKYSSFSSQASNCEDKYRQLPRIYRGTSRSEPSLTSMESETTRSLNYNSFKEGLESRHQQKQLTRDSARPSSAELSEISKHWGYDSKFRKKDSSLNTDQQLETGSFPPRPPRPSSYHYDPYIPPYDILKEVCSVSDGRKGENVPKSRSPSLVSKMTLEYLDHIGDEWQKTSTPSSLKVARSAGRTEPNSGAQNSTSVAKDSHKIPSAEKLNTSHGHGGQKGKRSLKFDPWKPKPRNMANDSSHERHLKLRKVPTTSVIDIPPPVPSAPSAPSVPSVPSASRSDLKAVKSGVGVSRSETISIRSGLTKSGSCATTQQVKEESRDLSTTCTQPKSTRNEAHKVAAPSTLSQNSNPDSMAGVPSPPTRSHKSPTLPKTKLRLPRSNLSAFQQLHVKSPPSLLVTNEHGVFRHPTTDAWRKQPITEKERRRREEEELYRKKRLEQLYEEEKQRKIQQEEADQRARKHSDFFTPSQKSPIPLDRFDNVQPAPGGGLTVPPERRRGFQIQGKARALYNFTAQNPRELSLRKGDTVYLLRQIDKNWFEGERYGVVGHFPVNYVEVLTSIEAAKMAAMQSEGQAKARYNFTAQSSVELSLRKGEFLVLLRAVDDNWFEGRIGNRQGIFPMSYVEVIREPSTPLVTPAPSVITTPMTGTPEMLSPVSMDAPTPPPQPSPSAFSQRSPTSVTYGYRQTSPSALRSHTSQLSPQYDLDPRPTSQRTQQSPTFGRKQVSPVTPGTGVTAPSNPIHIIPPDYRSKVPDDDLALTRYRAVYAYKPQNEDELELQDGDEIFVMEKCDDGWFVGTSARTGQFGTFPGNYVQQI